MVAPEMYAFLERFNGQRTAAPEQLLARTVSLEGSDTRQWGRHPA